MAETSLRILMLIPHLGLGGAQGAFLRLAQRLAKDAEVTLAIMQGDTTDAPAGMPIIQLSSGRGGKLSRWLEMWRRLRTLKRQHDVTISFLSGMNLLNALSGSGRGSIVSERGSKRHDIGMKPLQRFIWTRALDPLTYALASRVVPASEGLAHEIISTNAWVASRVIAIEGTIEASKLIDAADLPIEEELRPLDHHETVVTFGRLHAGKGYDLLLAAFAKVRTARPRARLLIIGQGSEEMRLRALAKQHDLKIGETPSDADVIFAGVRDNPLRYLRLGRVFAFPSRYEGLPNALIEAIAAGVPVLASDCPWGPRSILSEGTLRYNEPAPALPLLLPFGTLMPLPDAPGAVDVWASQMATLLAAPRPTRPPASERLANIVRYDLDQTGPRWLKLVEEVARHARQ